MKMKITNKYEFHSLIHGVERCKHGQHLAEL